MAIYPLHQAFGVRRVIASSYQAVSGTGARAIAELKEQVEAAALNRHVAPEVYPHPIAFNVLPHVGAFGKAATPTKKKNYRTKAARLCTCPSFQASVTCVRVPVYRAHSVAVTAEFERTPSLEKAREVLHKAARSGRRGRAKAQSLSNAAECRGQR